MRYSHGTTKSIPYILQSTSSSCGKKCTKVNVKKNTVNFSSAISIQFIFRTILLKSTMIELITWSIKRLIEINKNFYKTERSLICVPEWLSR